MKEKIKEAMEGPPNFEKLWKLMEESHAGTMELKLFKQKGDEKPFRAIILVNGKREVEEILALLAARQEEEN